MEISEDVLKDVKFIKVSVCCLSKSLFHDIPCYINQEEWKNGGALDIVRIKTGITWNNMYRDYELLRQYLFGTFDEKAVDALFTEAEYKKFRITCLRNPELFYKSIPILDPYNYSKEIPSYEDTPIDFLYDKNLEYHVFRDYTPMKNLLGSLKKINLNENSKAWMHSLLPEKNKIKNEIKEVREENIRLLHEIRELEEENAKLKNSYPIGQLKEYVDRKNRKLEEKLMKIIREPIKE